MNKIVLGLAIMGLMGATSCKKYRTCQCDVTLLGASSTLDPVVSDTKMTKKEGKDWCEKDNGTNALGSVSCKLQ